MSGPDPSILAPLLETQLEQEARERVARARTLVLSGATHSLAFRRKALLALARMLREHRDGFEAALEADLGKCAFESWATEIGVTLAEIRHARGHLGGWMRRTRRPSPLALFPARSEVESVPLGVVLIIAPWNYPLQLSLAPLVAAIAAGNAAVLKPSEKAPATSALLARLLPESLPDELVAVVPGGAETGAALVEEGFDHILFTGSRETGARVAEAAGRNLVPVTLELGGKCPVVVEESANLQLAARRISWGKFLNAGQTCVAPDHVFVPEGRVAGFLRLLRENRKRFYGEDPAKSPDYARIVNREHLDRLLGLLDGLPVHFGGESDPDQRYLAPTVTGPWPAGHPAGREEIFGPILPVIPYRKDQEVLDRIARNPDPLAIYHFGARRGPLGQAIRRLPGGALVAGDTVLHCANPWLPFGGVGRSGTGAYHGRYGFDRLSRSRAILTGSRLDLPVRYPPYAGKLELIRVLLR